MLLAGMDVSGDEKKTNYQYLGLIIGVPENIMSLSKNIGSYSEHMSRIDDKDKKIIIKKLKFDSNNRIAFCIKLDRKKIINGILHSRKARSKNIQKGKLFRTFNYVVMKEILKTINNFLINHELSVTNLEIQCDSDSKPFLKATGIKYKHKGIAYRISDYVAWANNRKKTPQTVIDINFTNEIPNRMKKILKLN